MAVSRGKQFELKFREDFSKIPGSVVIRLPDQVSGYRCTSANVCDFYCYVKPTLFFVEVKSTSGNTYNFSDLRQYPLLSQYNDIPGLRRGVVIWFTEKDRVVYAPITTITKMMQDGKKSINIRTIDTEEYDVVNIPSVKKRVFMDSDYSCLLDLPENW